MASSSKRKTTMAKLNRERGLAERRMAKAARKVARKNAAANGETLPGPEDLAPEGEHDVNVDVDADVESNPS
jgi:hypothetical protein